MKKIAIIILLTGCFTYSTTAQSVREKAIVLNKQAIALMDNGNIDEAIELLEQAQEIDPGYINTPYEMAFAYQMRKDYEKSISITKKLLKHPDVYDQVYQLLGISHSLKGEKDKAIKVFDKGLKQFPNSGKLYLEKGIVLAGQDKWFEALDVWEQGIAADPTHSSNYYYASQVLSQTDEKIWAVYYGEIFLNLEQNTPRTAQISKILYDTYKSCLPIVDNKWGLAFSRKAVNISLGNLKNFKISFETVHNLAMEQGYKEVEPAFTIDNLTLIRKQFLEKWNKDYAERYPNLIFDYHNRLIKNNLFTAYLYWLLKEGASSEFQQWKANNEETFSHFLEWFPGHPMEFPETLKTNRLSYQ